jgi:cytochrome b
MADYRDPKVTKTHDKKENNLGKWVGIALVALVALLLIGWMLGWFTDDEAEVETMNPAIIEETEDGAEIETIDPVGTE